LAEVGRHGEAIEEIRQAKIIDPLSLITNAVEGWILHLADRNDEAIEQLRETLEMDPNFPLAYLWIGQAYEQKGMYEEAIAAFQSAGIPEARDALGHAFAASDRKREAHLVLNQLKSLSTQTYVSPYAIALIYVGLGEEEQALEWLEKAYEDRSFLMIYLKVDPKLDPLRGAPRFQDLLRRMNFPE
jgi:serine/threonine-protein kinase